MIRSPPKLRPRSKPVEEKKTVDRPLSLDSDPASDNTDKTEMPLTKTDTGLIEATVTKILASEAICDTLVSKLADRLKVVVEEAVAAALKVAQDEIKNLSEVVSTLKGQVTDLQDQLEQRTDDLEQYQRRTNLRIFGVPEDRAEDTDRLVLQLVSEKLGVQLQLQNIDRSHRVGRPPQPGPDGKVRHRAIIVRFTSYRDRRRVFEAKKGLKGSGVTIREDLTARRQAVFQAAVVKHGLRNTWTMDGRIKWATGEGDQRSISSATRLSEVK